MRFLRYFRVSINFSKPPKFTRVDQNALFKFKVILMFKITLFLKRAFWSTLVNLGGFEKFIEIRKYRDNRIERRRLGRAPRRARGSPPYQTQGGPKSSGGPTIGRREPTPPLRQAGPNRTEPNRTEPDRTGPDRTGPNRTEPDRTGPNRTGPNRTEPNRRGPEEPRNDIIRPPGGPPE